MRVDRDFLQSKDFEIRELKNFALGSKEYRKKFTRLQLQCLSDIKKDFKQCSKDDDIYPYKRKRQIHIVLCVIFMLIAFVLLGFSIASLGDKEPGDFTSAEMQQFILWMGSVFISLCIGIFFAVRSGRYIKQYLMALIDNYSKE
jgi:predicted nucleic acid-binding Zn ribbon protein